MHDHYSAAPEASTEEIRRKYNDFARWSDLGEGVPGVWGLRRVRGQFNGLARWYDLVEGVPEVCGLSRLRRELLRRASGRVLEVAVGTGKNLRYYPRGCQITAVDLSPSMLAIARQRARRLGLA